MEGMHHSSGDMPGMMDEAQMAALEEVQGPEFDLAFIEMMSEHHEGAIEMAETVLAEGENAEVTRLAESIIEAQRSEIDRMRQWQQDWT